ncbi:hypothetical protein PRNP1_009675 [Phytophthora ramorum]
MMSTMSFPTCAAALPTFNVLHPLHCGPSAFRSSSNDLPRPMTINTFTSTPPTMSPSSSQLASPATTTMEARAHPVASPQKKIRKSRVRNCRRLGIVWPYRLMKSKKNAINWSAVSREDAQRIRQERALERAKAGRSPSSRSRSPSASRSSSAADADEVAAKVMTMLSHSSSSTSVELTEAGRAFARLPLDCMGTSC